MAVFVPDNVGNQGGRIAASARIIKIDTLTVVKSIAFSRYINVGGDGPIKICEVRHIALHVVVNQGN